MEKQLIEDQNISSLQQDFTTFLKEITLKKRTKNLLKSIFLIILLLIIILIGIKYYQYNHYRKSHQQEINKVTFFSFLQKDKRIIDTKVEEKFEEEEEEEKKETKKIQKNEEEKKKKILVIGSIGYDLTTYYDRMPVPGETIVGVRFSQNPGGKGDNQAVSAARAGGDVTFIGAIGDDSYAAILKKNLDDNKVKHQLKVIPNMNCQIATILVDKNGQDRIIIVPGANRYVDKKQIEMNEELIEENDIILLQLEIPIETVEYIIDIAYEKKKLIILNPAPGQPLPENILKKVDYLIPNENELGEITGMLTNTTERIIYASEKLIQLGVKNLIVTLGAKGSVLCNKDSVKFFDSYPAKAVDTTGAGDCFAGVLSAYLSKSYPIEEAIKYANFASSLSVSKIGTIPSFPTKKQIEREKKKIHRW